MPESGSPDELYSVVPEKFVAARDALVRRLRAEGDNAEAGRAAKLRRPPLSVWALNRVARADPGLIGSLFEAGSRLRSATEHALSGDASELRGARGVERAALDAVIAAAVRLLEDAGYSPTEPVLKRMAATLRAAIVDTSVAARLRAGVVEADHEAPGFGLDGLLAIADLAVVPDTASSAATAAGAASPAGAATPVGAAGAASEAASMATPGAEQTADEAEFATMVRRQRAAAEEADRLAAEADCLAAEADRLAEEATRLATEAEAAMARAQRASAVADSARQAALAQRAVADQLSTAVNR